MTLSHIRLKSEGDGFCWVIFWVQVFFWDRIFSCTENTTSFTFQVQGKSVSNRKESQKEGFFGSTKSDGDVMPPITVYYSFIHSDRQNPPVDMVDIS